MIPATLLFTRLPSTDFCLSTVVDWNYSTYGTRTSQINCAGRDYEIETASTDFCLSSAVVELETTLPAVLQ